MTEVRKKILFLPRWYPHRKDPMPGLFVKYQAEAVSLYCDVAVLHVQEEDQCPNTFEIEIAEEKDLKVVRVYYRSRYGEIPAINTIIRVFRFFKAYWLGLRILTSFPADLVHVHVLTRAGFVGYLIKKIFGRPYLISEHWSRYFQENNTYKGFLRKKITRRVMKNAGAVVAVSLKLQEAMQKQKLNNPNWFIVPNPVHPRFFQVSDPHVSSPVKRIIHVSCFDDKSKNISGFLHTIKNISIRRSDFEVLLVGEGPDLENCRQRAKDLGLLGTVVSFTGMKVDEDLSECMTQADFLVLSSHYETFGSVVVESLACGTPVVATNVGVVPEVINESNGIIVQAGDSSSMEAAIFEMLDKCSTFDRDLIRSSVKDKYSSETVGTQLFAIYCKILGQ